MSDYNGLVYRKQGGDELVVASGGAITVEDGGSLNVSDVSLRKHLLTLDIADGSADSTYYLVCPYAGTISKIWTVTDGAVSSADITVTGRIGSTAITNGAVTIATTSSAAGDIDSATPTAENTITAGAAINFVVAGGGSGGSPRIHLVVEITR